MDLLQPMFDMILLILEIVVNDKYFVGIVWTVIVVMLVLLLIMIYKEVFKVKWKR